LSRLAEQFLRLFHNRTVLPGMRWPALIYANAAMYAIRESKPLCPWDCLQGSLPLVNAPGPAAHSRSAPARFLVIAARGGQHWIENPVLIKLADRQCA
jgi:hypothetical protein